MFVFFTKEEVLHPDLSGTIARDGASFPGPPCQVWEIYWFPHRLVIADPGPGENPPKESIWPVCRNQILPPQFLRFLANCDLTSLAHRRRDIVLFQSSVSRRRSRLDCTIDLPLSESWLLLALFPLLYVKPIFQHCTRRMLISHVSLHLLATPTRDNLSISIPTF